MEPLLTICVPAYNVEAYLEHGLSTYNEDRFVGRLEVLVVNDGSTDSTAAIARTFVDRRPPAHLQRKRRSWLGDQQGYSRGVWPLLPSGGW